MINLTSSSDAWLSLFGRGGDRVGRHIQGMGGLPDRSRLITGPLWGESCEPHVEIQP